MADFDLGYFYYLHDKAEEEKELSASGGSYITTGITLSLFSFLLAVVFRKMGFLLIAAIGLMMLAIGIYRHSMVSGKKPDQLSKLDVELHHNDVAPHELITKPGILHERMRAKFSDAIAAHANARSHIAGIIKSKSGAGINEIYSQYKSEGGKLDASHFVKQVHALKRHGHVTVKKTISQTSRIPSSST